MSSACTAVEWREELTVPESATVVVNATSLGLPGSGDVPLAFDSIPANLVVCDVIPNPPDTAFLQRARKAGAKTLDGRGMLLNQAAINIELWTGIDPDRDVMGRALDRRLPAGPPVTPPMSLRRDRIRILWSCRHRLRHSAPCSRSAAPKPGCDGRSTGGFRRRGGRFRGADCGRFLSLIARC